MTETDKRIRAFSTKPRYVQKLKVVDVLAAMEPRPKPLVVAKANLRQQAEAAVAAFKGCITRLPAVDPAERSLQDYKARQSAKAAPPRRPTMTGEESE